MSHKDCSAATECPLQPGCLCYPGSSGTAGDCLISTFWKNPAQCEKVVRSGKVPKADLERLARLYPDQELTRATRQRLTPGVLTTTKKGVRMTFAPVVVADGPPQLPKLVLASVN